jgi:hypothetical protein
MYIIPAFIIGIAISFGVNAIVTASVISSFDPDQNMGKVSKVSIKILHIVVVLFLQQFFGISFKLFIHFN